MQPPLLVYERFNQDNRSLIADLEKHTPTPCFVTWQARLDKKGQKLLKVPDQLTNNPEQHLTLIDALLRSERVGLVINTNHDLIALDLDNVPLSDHSITNLLADYPTYVEYSPSGKPDHYRILYRVESSLKEQLTTGKLTLPRATSYSDASNIEVYIKSKNYVTLTGHAYESQPQPINLLPTTYILQQTPESNPLLALIAQHVKYVPRTEATTTLENLQDSAKHILKQVSTQVWLATVPCDESVPGVRRYCAKHHIDYYTYWLTGMMALHSLLGPVNGRAIALRWSQSDPDKFDQAAFDSTWESFAEETPIDGVTAATYLHMYNEIAFRWPVVDDKGKASIYNYENWRYFLDYIQLELSIDPLSKTLQISGPDHILYPNIFSSLEDRCRQYNVSLEAYAHRLSILATKYRIQVHPMEILRHLRVHVADAETYTSPKSLFQVWIESQPEYDPNLEPDYIAQLWGDAIHFSPPDYIYEDGSDDNTTLEYAAETEPEPSGQTMNYDSVIDKASKFGLTREYRVEVGRLWMYSLLRSCIGRYQDRGSEFMIILMGPQRTGKTTFAQNLLPPDFHHLYTEVTPMTLSSRRTASSMKDYYQQISTALVVNIDEGGFFFGYNQEFSDFAKSEVTSNIMDVRLPYGRIFTKMRRLYSLIMTTNDSELALPREGGRRYIIMHMDGLNHKLYNSIPRDRLFRQVLFELKKFNTPTPPWAPSQELLDVVNQYMPKHQKTTNLEEFLMSVYDFSPEGFAEAISLANEYTGTPNDAWNAFWVTAFQIRSMALEKGYKCSLKEVHHTLRYLCKKYNTNVPFNFVRTRIYSAEAKERNRQALYFMPVRFSRF